MNNLLKTDKSQKVKILYFTDDIFSLRSYPQDIRIILSIDFGGKWVIHQIENLWHFNNMMKYLLTVLLSMHCITILAVLLVGVQCISRGALTASIKTLRLPSTADVCRTQPCNTDNSPISPGNNSCSTFIKRNDISTDKLQVLKFE